MPFGLDPVSLGLGVATALPKLGLSLRQAIAAGNLRLQDTTTAEQREALAIARQRAASALPGFGYRAGRLAQTQAATIQGASLGAASGADYLAAAAAADGTRAQGELALGQQGDQYHAQAEAGLTQQLALQAQQRQRDLAAYNQQKAALTQASTQNLSNAVDGAAAYAAYGLNRGGQGAPGEAVDELSPREVALSSPYAAPFRPAGLPALGTRAGYGPAFGGGRYRNSALRFGMSY